MNDFYVHKFEKHFRRILSDVCPKSLQSCTILCDPVDHSPCISKCYPWDSQARILEWVAVPSSKGSSPLSQCPCTLKSPVTFINHLFHQIGNLWDAKGRRGIFRGFIEALKSICESLLSLHTVISARQVTDAINAEYCLTRIAMAQRSEFTTTNDA